ncbi:MAG: RNA polymerase sigma factor [Actinomycetota bacterium]
MEKIRDFETTLKAALRGEEQAWASIYNEYAPKVLGYLRARMAPDPEDLLSETLMQVVRDLARFKGNEDAFRSWLFTVAHHRMLDDARYRARRPQIAADEEALAGEAAGNAETEAIDSLTEQEIQTILARLPDEQQTVLLLRVFAGMTAPQIAEAMGKTVGAVKALQHRASQRLRQVLGDPGSEEAERVFSLRGVAMHTETT